MAAKIRSIAALRDVKQVINQSGGAVGMAFATSILGYNVSRLNVRAEMAKAIAGGVGANYERYARTWLEINSKIGVLGWGAAAYDPQGYWYINTPSHEGGGGVPIMCAGHDASKPAGAVMGPFKLP